MRSHTEPLPMDAPLVAKPGILDHALANLLAAFSGCVLAPIPSDVNPDHVHVPLMDEAGTPAFQSKLAINNVAVALGPRSRGLLAIKFADRPGLTEFLDRNPVCRQTLITEHADGAVIWHTVDVACRLPLDLPGCTVQMTGNVMVFNRDDVRRTDAFLHRATPTCVNLEDVDWGDDPYGTIAAWLARLDQGEFFRRGGRGQMIPNTRAWRAYLARRLKPTTVFDNRERQFYAKVNAGGWQPMTDDQMRDELRRLVTAAPVGNAESKSRITDEWLARLCARLKSSLAAHLPLVEGRLRVFLEQHLVKEQGANVTNAELIMAFANHCRQTGQPLLSANSAKVMLGRILRSEPWLVGYSKSIRRPAGDQNGWRGVRLRDQSIPSRTSDGAAGAPGAKI